jgi:hypothetical protein
MVRNVPLVGRVLGKPYLVAVGLLLTLAIFILAWAFSTFPGDRGALQGFQDNQSGWLDAAALGVTSLGGWAVAIALMLGMGVHFIACRRRIDALIVLLSGAPILAGFFLKEAVGRARPELFLTGAEPSSLSFPSGHSLFCLRRTSDNHGGGDVQAGSAPPCRASYGGALDSCRRRFSRLPGLPLAQ